MFLLLVIQRTARRTSSAFWELPVACSALTPHAELASPPPPRPTDLSLSSGLSLPQDVPWLEEEGESGIWEQLVQRKGSQARGEKAWIWVLTCLWPSRAPLPRL